MKNKSLIALLIGFAIPTVIMPIVSGLVEVAENQIEIAKGGQIKKITKINIENTQLAEELENLNTPVATNAIGFEIPSDYEEYVYEEEEECKHRDIGFK